MTVAEQYIAAFSNLAKETNTILLPSNSGDVSSMVSQVNTITHCRCVCLSNDLDCVGCGIKLIFNSNFKSVLAECLNFCILQQTLHIFTKCSELLSALWPHFLSISARYFVWIYSFKSFCKMATFSYGTLLATCSLNPLKPTVAIWVQL